MDQIRIGLDFGTHQTKVCIQTTPDEGHGQPQYEFFQFKDMEGHYQYVIPSLIQINTDDTLSYGYVDSRREKKGLEKPVKEIFPNLFFDNAHDTELLFNKYKTDINNPEQKSVLEAMLSRRETILKARRAKLKKQAEEKYIAELKRYHDSRAVYRYFKQATFADRQWDREYDSKYLCIWYLAYLIFLLEERFGENFSINMGVPVDETTYNKKKKLAVEILASSYYLVEEVYHGDLDAFLSEKIDTLIKRTVYQEYTYDLKEEYNINVFPEAYAGLITLTSQGKISSGMSLTADIGGGTTDVSFFTINNNKPQIYRYWSLPQGLNYIAENSGFDYFDESLNNNVKKDIVDKYNEGKKAIINNLIKDLIHQLRKETNLLVNQLYNALEDRVLVYNGGGSNYDFMANEIPPFKDVMKIDASMWKEENIKDKNNVSKICPVLTTAYGLSLCGNDKDVQLCPFTSLFKSISSGSARKETFYIDKDCC